jgi:hypothetical protein
LRAQLSVGHGRGDIADLVAGVFPPHDPTVLERMLFFRDTYRAWADRVAFATETPTYRLACFVSTAYELQVTIEPAEGNHRAVCQSVWDSLRDAARELDPKLKSLEIVDEATSKTVSTATTSFHASFARRDNLLLVFVALATAAWILLAVFTFGKDARGDVIGASIPGLLGGVAALVWAILDSWRGRLVWAG